MSPFLQTLINLPVKKFEPGEVLIEEDTVNVPVFVLKQGRVLITREGVDICEVYDPGSLFGEVASLLDRPSSATVKALDQTEVYYITDPKRFAFDHPEALLEVAKQLARRMVAIDQHFIESKNAFEELQSQMAEADDPIPHPHKEDKVLGLWMKTQNGLVRHWHGSHKDAPDTHL
ncbi:MAG: cyclic nucleotide-binding domain-containing protein [Verrucomicrobiota bacterium]|nr:cyclic nucleotide-binding domain-containing protein [Verrucomicrobiota bacterium]